MYLRRTNAKCGLRLQTKHLEEASERELILWSGRRLKVLTVEFCRQFLSRVPARRASGGQVCRPIVLITSYQCGLNVGSASKPRDPVVCPVYPRILALLPAGACQAARSVVSPARDMGVFSRKQIDISQSGSATPEVKNAINPPPPGARPSLFTYVASMRFSRTCSGSQMHRRRD